MDVTVTLTVNGIERTITTHPARPLLDVLREELHLTGAKYGCGEGRTPVAMADKKKVTTIEGLADGDSLHPVQQAFLDEGAIQCGYCTPGMIMSTVALLKNSPQPTDEQIVEWMNGNICRCNGYTKILKAVRSAAAQTAEVKIP